MSRPTGKPVSLKYDGNCARCTGSTANTAFSSMMTRPSDHEVEAIADIETNVLVDDRQAGLGSKRQSGARGSSYVRSRAAGALEDTGTQLGMNGHSSGNDPFRQFSMNKPADQSSSVVVMRRSLSSVTPVSSVVHSTQGKGHR